MKTIVLTVVIDVESGEAKPLTNMEKTTDRATRDRALQLLSSACLQLGQLYIEERVGQMQVSQAVKGEEE